MAAMLAAGSGPARRPRITVPLSSPKPLHGEPDGLSFAIELHGTGVSVSVIHPGYVESEIAQVDNAGRDRKSVV